MNRSSLTKLTLVILACVGFSVSALCSEKDTSTPAGGVHIIDPKLVGKWMWTKGSDAAYYSDNGVYKGSAYGFALQFTINADGSGTCFNHIHSTLGAGSSFEVNISSKGFFESDDQGHLGYFPLGGTYKSSRGEARALRPDELWDTKTNTGKNLLYQKVVVTKQGGRDCFQTTSSDGIVDSFFKIQ